MEFEAEGAIPGRPTKPDHVVINEREPMSVWS